MHNLIRIVILFSLFVGLSSTLDAQDFIYQRNNAPRIAAQNIQDFPTEIRYQLHGDESKVTYALKNAEISFVAFEDGTVRFFQDENDIKPVYSFNKNIFSFHLFDLIVNRFTLSYERLFLNGKIGLQIPVSLGFSDTESNGYDNVNDKYYSGVNLNFYPTGQGKVRYFLGPAVQLGQATYINSEYVNGQHIDLKEETFVFRFFVNNGLVISPVKDMSLSAVASVGIRYLGNDDGNDHEEIKTVGAFAFNLSYRF